MFLAHSSRQLILRLVVTGAHGSGALGAVEVLHSKLGRGEPLVPRAHGSWHAVEFLFQPEGLGDIRGYTVRVLVQGIDSWGPEMDPCDVSGFRDVDGILLVLDGRRIPEGLKAGRRLAESVTRLGYAWDGFPLSVAVDRPACAPDPITRALQLGERPLVAISLGDGSGVVGALKGTMKQMLMALRDGGLRVVEERDGATSSVRSEPPPIPVRSVQEIQLFEMLRPCSCGSIDHDVEQSLECSEMGNISSRTRRCRQCGAVLTLRYRVPETSIASGGDFIGGHEPSVAIEPGEFLELSDRYARSAHESSPGAQDALYMAANLLVEALKFAGDDGIPEELFRSSISRAHAAYAGRRGRERLVARLGAYRKSLG
jgi:hypothetical protein